MQYLGILFYCLRVFEGLWSWYSKWVSSIKGRFKSSKTFFFIFFSPDSDFSSNLTFSLNRKWVKAPWKKIQIFSPILKNSGPLWSPLFEPLFTCSWKLSEHGKNANLDYFFTCKNRRTSAKVQKMKAEIKFPK